MGEKPHWAKRAQPEKKQDVNSCLTGIINSTKQKSCFYLANWSDIAATNQSGLSQSRDIAESFKKITSGCLKECFVPNANKRLSYKYFPGHYPQVCTILLSQKLEIVSLNTLNTKKSILILTISSGRWFINHIFSH